MADSIPNHRALHNWAQAHNCSLPVYTEEQIGQGANKKHVVTIEMAGHKIRAQHVFKKKARDIAQVMLMTAIESGCGSTGHFCLIHRSAVSLPVSEDPVPQAPAAPLPPPIVVNPNRPVVAAWMVSSYTLQYVVLYTDGSVEATLTESKSRHAQRTPDGQRAPILSQSFVSWDHWKEHLRDHLIVPLSNRLSNPDVPLPFSEKTAIKTELGLLQKEFERPSPLPVE